MKLSTRTFCLDSSDNLYILPHTHYARMLKDPAAHPLVRFAAQPVRCAQVLVQRSGRKPTGVVSMNYFVLPFDTHGVLQLEAHLRAFVDHQLAARDARASGSEVVPGATLRWTPSASLIKLFHDAAIGKVRARRL